MLVSNFGEIMLQLGIIKGISLEMEASERTDALLNAVDVILDIMGIEEFEWEKKRDE